MPAVLIFIRLMDVVFKLDDVAFLVNWATRLTSSVGRNAVGIVNKVVLSAMVEEAVSLADSTGLMIASLMLFHIFVAVFLILSNMLEILVFMESKTVFTRSRIFVKTLEMISLILFHTSLTLVLMAVITV